MTALPPQLANDSSIYAMKCIRVPPHLRRVVSHDVQELSEAVGRPVAPAPAPPRPRFVIGICLCSLGIAPLR